MTHNMAVVAVIPTLRQVLYFFRPPIIQEVRSTDPAFPLERGRRGSRLPGWGIGSCQRDHLAPRCEMNLTSTCSRPPQASLAVPSGGWPSAAAEGERLVLIMRAPTNA